MNDYYTIYIHVSILHEEGTDYPVDVVQFLTCAIGACNKLEQANAGYTFGYRKATPYEVENAHIIQRNARRVFVL